MQFIISSLIFCLVAACGSKSKHKADPKKPNESSNADNVDDSKNPNKDSNPELGTGLDGVNFANEIVIREFASEGKDTAALFIIQPSSFSSTITIKEVVGPKFLGSAQVRLIDETFIENIFKKSIYPMLKTSKDSLLNNHRGARGIYFEGYAGRLCVGEDQTLFVRYLLNDIEVTSNFTFNAIPKSADNCQFSKISLLTYLKT